MKVNKFKLNEEGLKRFFGPLEARIMEIMWNHEQLTIKEVQQLLSHSEEVNFNTVMTVMNRLVEKGLLEKKQSVRSYKYQAQQSKEDFLHQQTKGLTNQLLQEFPELIVSHMVEALDQVDSELLKKLEDKLKELKEKK
jgi:predicted transcriptional regulator